MASLTVYAIDVRVGDQITAGLPDGGTITVTSVQVVQGGPGILVVIGHAAGSRLVAAALQLTVTRDGATVPDVPYDPFPQYLTLEEGRAASVSAVKDSGQFQTTWQPNTSYAKDTVVVSPLGQLVKRKAAGTSGTTYDASAWDILSGGTPDLSGYLTKAEYTASQGIASPAEIPGLYAWWDASQLSGLANNAAVANLPDLSGNGRHMTQATAANQPAYVTGQQNGKPVLRFDGSRWLATGTLSGLSQPYTVFLVVKPTLTGSETHVFGGGLSLTRLYITARTNGSYGLWAANNPDGAGTLLSVGGNDGAPKVISAVVKGGSVGGGNVSRIRVNGLEATTDALGIGLAANFVIGSSTPSTQTKMTGDFMEAAVFGRELSAAEIALMEAYLS